MIIILRPEKKPQASDFSALPATTRTPLSAARLACLTADAIERLTGIAPSMPLSRELDGINARGLMSKLAPAGGWRSR